MAGDELGHRPGGQRFEVVDAAAAVDDPHDGALGRAVGEHRELRAPVAEVTEEGGGA